MTTAPLRVLVLGASYGLLPGLKLALAGHAVTLVGRADEIAAMAARPLTVDLPLRRSQQRLVLQGNVAAQAAPGTPALTTPALARPADTDFVLLAMQEPQFAASDVADLLRRIGQAGVPCLSLMNLPPPPFLARLGTVPPAALAGVYSAAAAWTALPPELLTVASPDAQAVRLDPARPGQLTVTLASNFKAAPFADASAQALLHRLAHDMAHLKVDGVRVPVALVATSSPCVPLAKWPMLIAGNYRCVTDGAPRTIAQAVHDDLAATQTIYEAVAALARDLGAGASDLVPFAAYATAARGLARPSSLARALAGGAQAVERIDRLVLNLLRAHGRDHAAVASISARIDRALAANR